MAHRAADGAAASAREAQPERHRPLTVALIAGEVSGDLLGAAVARALAARQPRLRMVGVCGPRMQAAGVEALGSIDTLSVMGLVEVLRELPRLLRFRRQLIGQLTAVQPDVVVGIDAPDFNLGVERHLRRQGIPTLQLVCPSVWAWREGRVKTIAAAVDRVLCLLPFEPAFLAERGVAADYVGHPLADEIDPEPQTLPARQQLGLASDGPLVAILPGSRHGEIHYLAGVFARAAAQLAAQRPGLRFVTPVAHPALRAAIDAAIRAHAPTLDWTLLDGQSREAMQAADAVLLASGTATLECLLLDRPMVVAYRGSALTAWLMLKVGWLKTRFVSLPNLLASRPVVPELLQDAATPQALAAELADLLEGPAAQAQREVFAAVREQLRCNAATRAADVILRVAQSRQKAAAT